MPLKQSKSCVECSKVFAPIVNNQKYCSKACKRAFYRVHGSETTARQYKLISGNWEKYFGRLCIKSFRRELLSKQDCIDILKTQEYRCALTGVPLTCVLQKGTVSKTNASLDRIDPKGTYEKANVQLVCSAINKLRIDMSIEEYIEWCRKVTTHALCKQKAPVSERVPTATSSGGTALTQCSGESTLCDGQEGCRQNGEGH